MGSTVSLPEPYSCFPLLSVGDVEKMIHEHKTTQEGAFMVSSKALAALLGGSAHAVGRADKLADTLGRAGNVNALAFLSGVLVVAPPGGRPNRVRRL